MSETGFRFDQLEKKDPRFVGRVEKATAKIALAEQRRDVERAEAIEALADRFTPLDMSEAGKGANTVNAIMLKNAKTARAPMIFTRPTEEARDPVDVAFGDKDYSGKNIVVINSGSKVTAEDLSDLKDLYADGVTIIGNQSDTQIPASEYDNLLGENDAVVLMHPEFIHDNPINTTLLDKVA